jgi:hypothetical protein
VQLCGADLYTGNTAFVSAIISTLIIPWFFHKLAAVKLSWHRQRQHCLHKCNPFTYCHLTVPQSSFQPWLKGTRVLWRVHRQHSHSMSAYFPLVHRLVPVFNVWSLFWM